MSFNEVGIKPEASEPVMETLHLLGMNLPVDILKANPSSGTYQSLVLVIAGNPGLVMYYNEFVKSLFSELDDGKTAVWAISHACHATKVKCHKDVKNLVGNYPLDFEIEHKLQFIEQQVPANCKITLVGHSIGCYMILSVLLILQGLKDRKFDGFPETNISDSTLKSRKKNENLHSRIEQCYFLFPTIERMKETSQGKKLWPALKYLKGALIFFIGLISWFPLSLKTKIAQFILGKGVASSSVTCATMDLFTPEMFGNMLKLAYNELQSVNNLDKHTFKSVKDKLTIYYGKTDHWCPLSYRDELLLSFPDIKNYVDNIGTKHAFVLKSSKEMAAKLASIKRSQNLF